MLSLFKLPSLRPSTSRVPTERVYLPIIAALATCALGLVAIYLAIGTEWFHSFGEPVAAISAIALLGLALRRWQFGVQALLVVVIVEGALRKWFLPSYGEFVYFYKDALMGAILLGYFRDHRKTILLIKSELKIVFALVGTFAIYAVASVANASAPHAVVSLFGLKAYCLYMPLAFLVPRMFPTKEKVIAFLRWYLVTALAVAAIGAWQFLDGRQDSALNRYAWSEEVTGGARQATALFADASGEYFVRITSTFSFITGLGTYLPVVFALLLGLTSLRSSRALPLKIRSLYYLAIVGVVATALMSGSRAVTVNLAIVMVVFFVFTSLKNAFRRLRQFAVVGLLIYVTLTLVSPQAASGLYQRAFGGESQIEEGGDRIAAVFSFPFEEASYAGAFGYGIGALQNGVPALMRTLDLSHQGEQVPIDVESEASRVMLEIGVVGFLLFMVMKLGLLPILWRACVTIRDPETKALAIACLAALVFPMIAGGAVTIHTQNVLQWFLIGLILALLNASRLAHATAYEFAIVNRRSAVRTPMALDDPLLDRR